MNPSTTITRIDTLPMRLPFDHGGPAPMFAGKPRTRMGTVLVRVELAGGTVGWGEAYGATLEAVLGFYETHLRPLALDQDASDTHLITRIERTLHNIGRSGLALHAISGLDIALWDIRAKLAGVPLHQLLGGAKHKHVPAYASLLQYNGDVDLVQRRTERALRDGYRAVKLHERSAAPVLGARSVMGDGLPLMLDTNCAWNPSDAREHLAAMAEARLMWVEEPLFPPEDTEALLALRTDTGVPTAIGENAGHVHELCRWVREGAVDYVQPSAIKLGGLSPLLRVAQACTDAVRLAPHCSFFGPSFLATLHLLATQPQPVPIERIECGLAFSPYARAMPLRGGGFDVPDGPGLGIEPDPELLDGRYG